MNTSLDMHTNTLLNMQEIKTSKKQKAGTHIYLRRYVNMKTLQRYIMKGYKQTGSGQEARQ